MNLKRLALLTLLLTMTVSLSGCQFFQKPQDNAEEGAEAEEGGEEEVAVENVLPPSPKPSIDSYRPISVVMPDGLKVEGHLYVPHMSPYKPKQAAAEGAEAAGEEEATAEEGAAEGEEAPAKKKTPKRVPRAKVQYPLVILLHTLSGDRWEWKEYPRHLVAAGYAVLAIDLRGHGDSVYRGKLLRVWRDFDKVGWQKAIDDPKHLLAHIAQQPEFNNVNVDKVAMIGGDVGANLAVNYASQHQNQVEALVLLSPGLEYYGIQTFEPMTHYENAVFYAASQEDNYAAQSAQRLYKFTFGKKKIQIFKGIGHGVDMLHNNPDLAKEIIAWLKGLMPPPEGAAVADAAPAAEDKAAAEDEGKADKAVSSKEEAAKKPPADTKKAEKDSGKASDKATTSKEAAKKPADKPKTDDKKPSTANTSSVPKDQSVKPATATLKPAASPSSEVKPVSGEKTPVSSPATSEPKSSGAPSAGPMPVAPVSSIPEQPSQEAKPKAVLPKPIVPKPVQPGPKPLPEIPGITVPEKAP